jgi:carboxymethylenebutenolidase
MATAPEYKLKCSSTLHRPKDGVAFFSSNDPTENIMSNGTSVSASVSASASTSVSFRRPDGGTTNGYLAMASGAANSGKPGVVVIQEWWGLNDHIRAVADRFAAAGYNALAPDLYEGRVAKNADEAGHMMNGLDFAGATHQDIRGAVNHLHELGSKLDTKVCVVGFCMGGALTIAAAVHVPGINAAVCFYGIPPAEFASPAAINIPFQGHFANRDDWCTPAAVDTLETAMVRAKLSPDIHRYDADHAFFNTTRPEVFDAAAANLAWQRTLAFLGEHLA